MTAIIQDAADIINLALTGIGYKLTIGSVYDGSEAGQRSLTIYSQTRDDLLRQSDWGFAERNVALTLLKSAPTQGYIPPTVWNPAVNPAIPYGFEYLYPDDCIKVRALKQTPLFLFNPDPQPILLSIANDTINTMSWTLAALALNNAGAGVYAPNDIVTLTGGVQSIPASLIVTTTKVVSASIAAPGTGGTPGSATVTGTTGTGTKFQATVTISGGGVITSVDAISLAGSYTVNPAAPAQEPVTGASLAGAKLNLQLGIATFALSKGGVFTTQATTFTQALTSGTGTGATFQTATYTALTETVRVILCNIADAICVYTGQITNPADMDVSFIDALAGALGKRLLGVLVGMQAVQPITQDEMQTKMMAEREQG